MKKILSIACVALLLAGCTTLGDARLAKGTGIKRTYDASFNTAWKAAVCSVNGLGLSIATENKTDGYILAQRGMTAFSYGENVAVFVYRKGANKTEIEVVSKRAVSPNITARNWTEKVLNGVNGCL